MERREQTENGAKAGVTAVAGAFARLGCTAFGGPVAHLGYFHEEFVRRRGWISEKEYADLVALCQFLPGPASSQVGFAIGLKQAGLAGGMAAWLTFTAPSVILMIGFAFGLNAIGSVADAGWLIGLKLAAVAVVANALWGMATQLCPDRTRAALALLAAALLLISGGPLCQPMVIALGAAAGWLLLRQKAEATVTQQPRPATSSRMGWVWLLAFVLLLAGLPILAVIMDSEVLAVLDAFYRAGSLVFGGGHVVLPLLDNLIVVSGWLSADSFLAGYGAAQALPGPLFAFSAFLGSAMQVGPGGVAGGLLALGAIYLPSLLLVLGAMPYWERLRHSAHASAALAGANAAVVGLLLAALYDPVWISAVTSPARFAFALLVFGLLRLSKLPVWAIVGIAAVAGQILLNA